MKRNILVLGIWLAAASSTVLFGAEPNTLTEAQKAAGWKLLFDGKTSDGWRGFNLQTVPANWAVSDGCLHNTPIKKKPRDLITDAMYDTFELEWDWKVAPKANSGLKYYITEASKLAIGFEYQMIDDLGWDPKHSQFETIHGTGALYDLLPPKGVVTVPLGEFNHSRIVVSGQRIEHWLNGKKVVQADLGSSKLKSAIARSKFKDVPRFGEHKRGHILLQDHGDEVWFRNIKIRSTNDQSANAAK
jgi:hypothetical protein